MTANSPTSDSLADSNAPSSTQRRSGGTADGEMVFHTTEVIENGNNPISPMAFLALGLGLVGLIAIVNPLWLIVGIGAAIFGGATAMSLSRKDSIRSGAKLALVGCVLGCFASAWNVTASVVQRNHMKSNAIDFGMQWLELVHQGRMMEAREWMLPAPSRIPGDVDLEAYYKTDGAAREALGLFLSDQDIVAVSQRGDLCDWKIAQYEGMLPRGEGMEVSLIVEDISYKRPPRFYLRMLRTVAEDADGKDYANWNITEFRRIRPEVDFK